MSYLCWKSDRPLIAIDCETSHWDKASEFFAVTQIGAIASNGWMIMATMDPGEEILSRMQPDVVGLTGLTPAVIRREDAGTGALDELTAQLSAGEPAVIVAHNWPFDRHALNAECDHRGIRFDFSKLDFVDTYRVVQELYDEGIWEPGGSRLPNMKLATCFYGIVPERHWDSLPAGRSHTALYDASMSLMVMRAILEMGTTIEDLISISRQPFIPRTCPMGKDKGKAWANVDAGFLSWMAQKRVWGDNEGLELAVLTEMERRGML